MFRIKGMGIKPIPVLLLLYAVVLNLGAFIDSPHKMMVILSVVHLGTILYFFRAMQTTEDARTRFLNLLDKLGETVFVCSEDRVIDLINEHGKRTLQLFKGDKMPISLVPEDILTELFHRMANDHRDSFLVYKTHHKDREFSVKIQSGGSNQGGSFSGSILDISETEKSHYYSEKYYQQSALAFLGSIFENLAHEIRTPCMAAEGCFKMIQEDIIGKLRNGATLSEDDIQALRRYCENGSRTTSQISDLLNHSRSFRHGYRRSEIGDIDLRETCLYCKETIEAAYNSIISGHIHIEVPDDGSYIVQGYLNRFLEALGNILKNSVEAITERARENPDLEPEILIRLRRDSVIGNPRLNEILTLEVLDNGSGFSENIRGHLGTTFFTTKGHSLEHKGTGLGLALAIRTINAMGGTWEIENREDTGTRTIIKFPLPQDLRYDGS